MRPSVVAPTLAVLVFLLPHSAAGEIVATAERALIDPATTSARISITDAQIASLPSSARNVLDVAALRPGITFDEVRVSGSKRFGELSTSGTRPEDWVCEDVKNGFACRGHLVSSAFLSYETSTAGAIPDRLEIEVRSGGRRIYREHVPVVPVQIPPFTTSLENAYTVPRRLTPGAYFFGGTLNDAYRNGSWQLQYDTGAGMTPVPQIDLGGLGSVPDGALGLGGRLYTLPQATAGLQLRATYRNEWGDTLVQAPVEDFAVTEPVMCPNPIMVACQRRVSVGGSICVCGCFPEPWSWTGLRLDGEPVSLPFAGSPFVAHIALPDIEPGTHTLSWAAGTGGQGSVRFEAVKVGGKLAAEEILKGRSTLLTLAVDGSTEKLKMEIETRAPTGAGSNPIIALDGGNKQTARTSGGPANDVKRKLKGLRVGKYDIDFWIDLPSCPCEQSEWNDDEVAVPLQLSGKANLRARDLDLSLAVSFRGDNVVASIPRPPIDLDNMFLRVEQLDLQGSAPGLPSFTLQTRYGEPSTSRFSGVRLDDQGRFIAGDVDLDIPFDFSVSAESGGSWQVGRSYTYDLEDWGFSGNASGMGDMSFVGRPGGASSFVLDSMQSDAAQSTYFTTGLLRLQGRLECSGGGDIAPTSSGIERAATDSTDLRQAWQQGWIDIGYRGLGSRMGDILRLDVTRKLDYAFPLRVPAGMVFVPEDRVVSSMIVGEDVEIDLGRGTTELAIRGFSLDRGLSVPPSGSALAWTPIYSASDERYRAAAAAVTADLTLGANRSGVPDPETYSDVVRQGLVYRGASGGSYSREDFGLDLPGMLGDATSNTGDLGDRAWSDISRNQLLLKVHF